MTGEKKKKCPPHDVAVLSFEQKRGSGRGILKAVVCLDCGKCLSGGAWNSIPLDERKVLVETARAIRRREGGPSVGKS